MNEQGWVAVIDDDASVRRSLRRMLNAHGVRVETYGSAEEFLEPRNLDPPQCIVVDIQLAGGMSGLELLGMLASDPAAPAVVLMTGLEIADTLMRPYGGRARLLRKPFEAARLMALLPAHLQHPAQAPLSPTTTRPVPGTSWTIDSR
jgi:FixJ family two-component response regulator